MSADSQEVRQWLRFAQLAGVNHINRRRLLASFGSAAALFDASDATIKATTGANQRLTSLIRVPFDQRRLEAQCDALERHQITLINCTEANYPAQLAEIADAPAVLFVRGSVDLLSGPQLAIVGSRNATPAGVQTAEAFGEDLSRSGITVTSGLALGIDAASHRGALDQVASTIAVVATGLDQVYPKRNANLAQHIIEKGAMVSEFAPMMPPRRENFPLRNRIISGLSMGVLVVEAGIRSGSLITARLAGEQGREIYAIPGSIHVVTYRGCHRLIREGAKLVETTADVLVELKSAPQLQQWLPEAIKSRTEPAGELANSVSDDDSDTVRLLNLVDFEPISFDDIVAHSGLPVESVSSILLQLELTGEVAPLAGGRYQRLPKR